MNRDAQALEAIPACALGMRRRATACVLPRLLLAPERKAWAPGPIYHQLSIVWIYSQRIIVTYVDLE